MTFSVDTAAKRALNPMILEGLWIFYREVCWRVGVASIAARIARKALRDYTRTGQLT